jgi:hypothetical protein
MTTRPARLFTNRPTYTAEYGCGVCDDLWGDAHLLHPSHIHGPSVGIEEAGWEVVDLAGERIAFVTKSGALAGMAAIETRPPQPRRI